MLLERVDPFLAEFDRLTQRTFGTTTDGVSLPMDVVRRDDALIVRVDLPGVARDQISVGLENRTLTISAERRSAYTESDAILCQERFDGAMNRRLRVPDWIDAENVAADLTDGVLTVTMPLAERAKPRQIPVSGSEPAPAVLSSS